MIKHCVAKIVTINERHESDLSMIGKHLQTFDLHIGIILRQLPESFTLTVSRANFGNCYLTPLGLQNLNNREKTK